MKNIPESKTTIIEDSANQGGMRMWPSAETASWLYSLANIGLIIGLVVGVVSTILLVWMGNVKEEYLNRALADSRERTASLEKQSGESKTAIAKANADAAQSLATAKQAEANLAEANERASQAGQKAAEASAKAEGFRLDIAKANERAAEANRMTESERLARLQLEARLADWRLTAEQQTRLISLLNPFPGTDVDVVVFGDTAEIKTIGMIIVECIGKAGWQIHFGTPMGTPIVVKGILVGVRSDANTAISNAATTLISGLQSMGINAGSWDFNQMPYPGAYIGNLTQKASMKIFIGSKP